MRADCAAYDLARQSREDNLIATITQISSAALLGIPGIFFGKDQQFPVIKDDPLLYLGIFIFLATLIMAMVEQYLSAKAYRKQSEIAQKYYLLKSPETVDKKLIRRVRFCRNLAVFLFGVAVAVSTTALMMLERIPDGRAATTSKANANTAVAAIPALSGSSTGRTSDQIRSQPPSTAAAQTVKVPAQH
jgi:ABC-type Fe3+-siderophore transport system permease subunit